MSEAFAAHGFKTHLWKLAETSKDQTPNGAMIPKEQNRYFRGFINLALEDDFSRLATYFRSGRFSMLYLAFPLETWLKNNPVQYRDPRDASVVEFRKPQMTVQHAYEMSQAVGHANLTVDHLVDCALHAVLRKEGRIAEGWWLS